MKLVSIVFLYQEIADRPSWSCAVALGKPLDLLLLGASELTQHPSVLALHVPKNVPAWGQGQKLRQPSGLSKAPCVLGAPTGTRVTFDDAKAASPPPKAGKEEEQVR